MSLIDTINEEDFIANFVEQILAEDPDFELMSDDEQDKIFGIYTLLITAVHRATAYDNVYPVVYANDSKSKKVVERAIENVTPILPNISRITVSLVN